MLLGELAGIDSDSEVTGFALDHRKVARGNIFGAFRGSRFNGEDFISEAVRRGAVAVVTRPEAPVEGATHLAADEPRKLFADLAARYFEPYPDTIVAVTGTNGKTSTVELTRQLWRMAGHRSASIGTLGVTTADDQVKTGLTTPDIVTFLSNMAGLKRMGVSHVAYEASSHGLDQYRAESVPVRAAAFTNLSRDHLDYHADMDSYFAAKMRLFDEVVEDGGTAVVWTRDARSAEVIERARNRGLKLLTVGPDADDIRLVSRQSTPLGQSLVLGHDHKEYMFSLPLIGAYQVNNVLTAAGLTLATGADWATTLAGMGRVSPVRGRLERSISTMPIRPTRWRRRSTRFAPTSKES
jgi:UDP-N-acetylmuramoyl-L-alanyl-D-glutamate--2,6-diaminopimelate ligase